LGNGIFGNVDGEGEPLGGGGFGRALTGRHWTGPWSTTSCTAAGVRKAVNLRKFVEKHRIKVPNVAGTRLSCRMASGFLGPRDWRADHAEAPALTETLIPHWAHTQLRRPCAVSCEHKSESMPTPGTWLQWRPQAVHTPWSQWWRSQPHTEHAQPCQSWSEERPNPQRRHRQWFQSWSRSRTAPQRSQVQPCQ